MEKLKRWVPVLALTLALVLGFGQPLQTFASTVSFLNTDVLDLPLVDSVTEGDYVVSTYRYSSDWSGFPSEGFYFANSTIDSSYKNVAVYGSTGLDGFSIDSYFYSPSSSFLRSTITIYPCRSNFAVSQSGSWNSAGFGFLIGSILDDPDLVSFTMRVKFQVNDPNLRRTKYKVDAKLNVLSSSTKYSGRVVPSSEMSISPLSAISNFTVDIELTDARDILSGCDVVTPSFYVQFDNIAPLDEILITVDSIDFIVKTLPGLPATPVVDSSWGSSPLYYAIGSSASSLYVTSTFDPGAGNPGSLSYQWYENSVDSTSGGTAISGATNYVFVPPTSSLGTFYYYCKVTNTYQGNSVSSFSSVACVKVVDAPKAPQITQNLSGGTMEYTQGDRASPLVISAINSGDGTLSYQWYRNSTNSTSGGTAISGATKSSYTPSTATIGTQYYYCVVSNSVGTLSESITSNVAAIRVVPPPDPAQAPVINPNLSTSIKDYFIGDTAAPLKIGATVSDGGTLSYQWYSNTVNSSSDGTLLPGETDRTFTPPTDTLGVMYYYCVVTNTLPDSSSISKSNVACIRVNKLPEASAPVISTDLPQDPIVYTQGDAASAIGISARSPDGGVLTYQWFKNVVAENTGGTAIAGADGPSYEPATSEVGTAYYYVVITNTLNGTSASVTSRVATVIVEQDQVPDLIGDVIDGIMNLPQAIMDGIVGLFVPNADAIAAYQNQWTELLSSRFGAVYESVMLLDEFAQSIQMQDEQNTVPFPSVTLDLAGVPFTFGGWTVQVVPPGFEFVIEMLKRIVSIVATLAFLNSMRNKFERVLGGG